MLGNEGLGGDEDDELGREKELSFMLWIEN